MINSPVKSQEQYNYRLRNLVLLELWKFFKSYDCSRETIKEMCFFKINKNTLYAGISNV